MEKLYVACELGPRVGRIMLGTLQHGLLTVGEVRRFHLTPVSGKESLTWDIAPIYQELILALRELGAQEANIQSISVHSWPHDYFLFDAEGALLAPVHHHADPRSIEGLAHVQRRVAAGLLHAETGAHVQAHSTVAQLASEPSRRLKRAHSLLPIADGFNFLLSGVPAAELSMASTTGLFNPTTRAWSDSVAEALDIRRQLLPLIAHAGMKLGPLRAEIAADAKLEGVQVIATCSNELAASLAGLPLEAGRDWAYLRIGAESLAGTELFAPLIDEVTRKSDYINELAFGGVTNFYKRVPGLWILQECKRHWLEKDRELSVDVLMHLATTSPAFECLINVADPRFSEPGDMPAKIQAYCRETGQEPPRKPGQIIRCVLESLALHYRKTLHEIEVLTGRKFARVFLMGAAENSLLDHFIANAVQVPVILVSPDAAVIGNVLVQALALGHIKSLEEGHELVRKSFRTQAIIPHPAAWDVASGQMVELLARTADLAAN